MIDIDLIRGSDAINDFEIFKKDVNSIEIDDVTELSMTFAKETDGSDWISGFVVMNHWFDSPIEQLFYYCFHYVLHKYHKKLVGKVFLVPQYAGFDGLPYRVDFLVGRDYERSSTTEIVVECDGHEFHSTKEQIKKDNKRQREIENLGYSFLRFSGSEIYNDSEKCAEEVFKRIEIFDADYLKEGDCHSG